MTNEQLLDRWARAMLPAYGPPSLALVRGRGSRVWDADGREYLDLLAGIAVNVLGHAHPAVVAAVCDQVGRLGHVSNLYANPVALELAERLVALTGREGKVFFTNSGAEANEAAFKLARRTGRPGFVTALGGFHGRTMGALAWTGQPAKQAPFRPLPPETRHVPFGDRDALRAAVGVQTAAVVLEPVQGEGGVVPAPVGYLAAARQVADEAGALLVLDEVQTGIGRTGSWFAHQADGVTPDVMTLAKGLGGGLPLGACVAFGESAALLRPGEHGSTFGGNPVSCAAALAVLDVVEQEGLLVRATATGRSLSEGVMALGHPLVREVRGRGLLLGIVLDGPTAGALERSLRSRGVLVNAVAPDVVRLAPALVIDGDDVKLFLAALSDALDALMPGAAP